MAAVDVHDHSLLDNSADEGGPTGGSDTEPTDDLHIRFTRMLKRNGFDDDPILTVNKWNDNGPGPYVKVYTTAFAYSVPLHPDEQDALATSQFTGAVLFAVPPAYPESLIDALNAAGFADATGHDADRTGVARHLSITVDTDVLEHSVRWDWHTPENAPPDEFDTIVDAITKTCDDVLRSLLDGYETTGTIPATVDITLYKP